MVSVQSQAGAAITNSNLQTLETIDFSLKFDSCRRVERLKWRQLVLNSELLSWSEAICDEVLVKIMHSDPVQNEYAHLAPRYDRRWFFYVNATVQKTMNRLDINSHERILDLGCGTGTLIQRLLHLAPETELVGLDPSAEMLSVARQKLPESVELQVGSADNIPYPNESFDFGYFDQCVSLLP